MSGAPEHELHALCQGCGMCCDGSLFGRVGLERGEVPAARRHGLRVVERGGSFLQPCPAFSPGGCGIYAERPHACRAFRCALLEEHRREGGPLEARLAVVARMRDLLSRVDAGLTDAEFDELERRANRDFARA